VRSWLADPPDGLTITEDLDGVTVTFPASGGARKHLAELISVLTMFPLIMGGVVLGVLPWMGLMERGVLMFLLGFAGACVTMVIGLLLGFLISLGIQFKLEQLLGVQRETSVRILEHVIVLAGESVALSEVLFVAGEVSPELVLRGGRRIPIVPGAGEEKRRWFGGMIGTLVRQRVEGSEVDIPVGLGQLKRPVSRPIID
jgi:hypothetical protein